MRCRSDITIYIDPSSPGSEASVTVPPPYKVISSSPNPYPNPSSDPNLRRQLLGQPLQPFTPQSSFLGLIGTGDGGCVASRGSLAYEASWLWELKVSEP